MDQSEIKQLSQVLVAIWLLLAFSAGCGAAGFSFFRAKPSSPIDNKLLNSLLAFIVAWLISALGFFVLLSVVWSICTLIIWLR